MKSGIYENHLAIRQSVSQKLLTIIDQHVPIDDVEDYAHYFWRCPFLAEDKVQRLMAEQSAYDYFSKQFTSAMLIGFEFQNQLIWQHGLQQHRDQFEDSEAEFLSAWEHAIVSYFQIKECCQSEYCVTVEDIFNDKIFRVKDKNLSCNSRKHDVFGGLIVPYTDDAYVLEYPALTQISPMEKPLVCEMIQKAYQIGKQKKDPTLQSIQDFLRKNSVFIFWIEMYMWIVQYEGQELDTETMEEPTTTFSEEVLDCVTPAFIDHLYDQWIHAPHAYFDGKTPKEASLSPEWTERLKNYIDELENTQDGLDESSPMRHFDFDRLRDILSL